MKHLMIIMTLLMSIVLMSCNPREQREKSRHVVESTIVEQQKPQLTPVTVATELINVKQTNIELDMLDSVFKTIPDEIIIFICNDSNLDLDTIDSYSLTRLYLSKKDYYDNIIDKYDKIEKFKKHDKLFEPDKKPEKAELDETNQNVDSTKSHL